MSGFDEGRVFWSDQNQGSDQNGSIPRKVMERQLAEFIRTFYRDGTFTYREMLVSNTNMGEFKLEVLDLVILCVIRSYLKLVRVGKSRRYSAL